MNYPKLGVVGLNHWIAVQQKNWETSACSKIGYVFAGHATTGLVDFQRSRAQGVTVNHDRAQKSHFRSVLQTWNPGKEAQLQKLRGSLLLKEILNVDLA